MSKIPWKYFLPKCLPTIQGTPAADDEASSKDQLIFNNFNTLYHHDLNNSNSELELSSTSKSHLTAADNHFYSSSSSCFSDSSDDIESSFPPDFATILASQRFFFSSPGRSNSIVESPDTRPTINSNPNPNPLLSLSRSISVPKYSSNPYADFRHSMEEMLEARCRDMVVDTTDSDSTSMVIKSDLEYLHELLLCYLSLNPKDIHKDIINAFTDLVICLLSSHSSPPTAPDHRQQQQQHPHLLRQLG